MSKLNPNATEFTPSWMRDTPTTEQDGNPSMQGEDVEESWDDADVANTNQVATDLEKLKVDSEDVESRAVDDIKVKVGDGAVDGVANHVGVAVNDKVEASKMNGDSTKEEKEEVSVEEGNGEVLADNEGEEEEMGFKDVGDKRKAVNIVFIGHVDAGKSTISGHILYLTGNVDDRTMEKYEKEAKSLNRESWKYAWALDTSDQERAKGKTEECGRATFQTETRRFIILDAPGHKNFVPHMIGGASQADIGILVISARKGEFETGFERGGQTREHAVLAKTSGVRQLIVLVNKLDDPSVINPDGTWSQERYDYCKNKLSPFLKSVAWHPQDVFWVPASGLTGQNLKDPVSKKVCPWYDGESLIHTLEHMNPPERLINAPVRMPLYDKYRDMGTVVMGKLQSGVIKVNDKLIMMPNRAEVVVDGMALEGSEEEAALPGDNVRLRIKGIEEEDIHAGFVICSPGNVANYSKLFDVQLMILEHKSIICAGYTSVIHIHAAVEECSIDKLIAEIGKDRKIKQRYPKFVKPGMKVIARLRLQQPICVEPFDQFPQLGRFMLRDEGRTIAVGTVKKIRDAEGSTTEETGNAGSRKLKS